MNEVAKSLYIKINEKKSLFIINTNKVQGLEDELHELGLEIPVSDTQKLVGINLKLKSDLTVSYKPHFISR